MIIVGLEDVRHQDNEEDTTSDLTDVDELSTTLTTSSQDIESAVSKPNPLIALLNGNRKVRKVGESGGDTGEATEEITLPAETTTTQRKPVLLMSILNGNKKEVPKESTEGKSTTTDVAETLLPTTTQLDNIDTTRKSNVLASLLNGNKKVVKEVEPVEQTFSPDIETTMSLEERMYSNVKSTSVKDLFSSYKKRFDGKVVIRLPSSQLLKIQNTVHKDTKLPQGNELESRIFHNAKLTSARDLFNNFKTKNNENGNVSSFPVTFKIDPKKLAKVSYFVTRGNNSRGKSCRSLFSEMMSASRNIKLTPLQKVKEISPPIISRTEFHVFDGTLDQITPKLRKLVHLEDQSGTVPSLQTKVESHPYIYETKEVDKKEYALQKLPRLQKTPPLNAIYNRLDIESEKQLWVDKFQPKSSPELVMHRDNIQLITQWINSSFEKLKAQAPVKNLNHKLKKRRLDSFIVEDETEEEISLPFLILQGSSGSGKSTAVYTAMKEIDGYVHEINSGMARGRKDIYNSLKELSTTQLVHDTKDTKPGLIFFEDVNILFEQDKTFWLVVQDIINVSKRPIVITCEELWNIPKNLLDFAQEDDSIIFIDDRIVSRKLVVDYLWMCCLSEGFDIGNDILGDIVDDMWNGHNYDLRGCLMSCEILCKRKLDSLVAIRKKPEESARGVSVLQEMALHCELNSCGDVYETCYESQIPQASSDNELFDIYCVDDSAKGCLPFELNIGSELQQLSKADQTVPAPKFTFNDLQYECQQFIGSRSKKMTPYYYQKLSKRATRSNSDFTEPTTGIPETSFIYNISPTPFILDLLPFARTWQVFQTQLDIFETNALKEEKPSVKKFLQYRDFQHKSTIGGTLKIE